MRGFNSPAVHGVFAVVLALGLGLATTARAGDGVATTITGYGTLGGTFVSDGDYAYRHDSSEFVGATNRFDVGLESRIGVQAVFDFGSGFSVTAQEVARRRGSEDFSLGTEWLYAQYSPAAEWKLRVGRVVLPTFLLSDSREVGYAAPWFRAPNEIYASEPFNYLDGGQVLWRHSVDQAALSLQSSYGRTKQRVETNGGVLSIDANYVFNASASIEYANVLVRVAETNISSPLTIPLSATYSLNFNAKDKYLSVGIQYDDGKAIALGEWAKRSESNAPGLPVPLVASTQWYAAGGWRFGKLTPMLLYGKYKPDQSLLFPAGDYGTWSASLRYDVIRNVALKAEISRVQAGNGFYWVTPNLTSREHLNVYSFGADFVF
jgi:hypothetical protein